MHHSEDHWNLPFAVLTVLFVLGLSYGIETRSLPQISRAEHGDLLHRMDKIEDLARQIPLNTQHLTDLESRIGKLEDGHEDSLKGHTEIEKEVAAMKVELDGHDWMLRCLLATSLAGAGGIISHIVMHWRAGGYRRSKGE